MSQTPLTVCLIQHSPNSDNLGVGALTASQVVIVRDVAKRLGREVRFVIVAWKDLRAPYITGPDIEIFPISRNEMLSPGGYLAVVRKSDLVLDIGGGDSFADIYGGKRLLVNLFMKEVAHLARTPVVLSPQTIGPFKAGWARRLSVRAMRKAAAVYTRDTLSTNFSRETGYKGDLVEASDVAFRLPYDTPGDRPDGEPVRVGLNISGLLMNGGYTGANMFGLNLDYKSLVRQLIETFTAMEDVELHLVPHVISDEHPVEDDWRASEALAGEFGGIKVAPKFGSPSEAKSYIAGLDFFAGARMHACIAALSSGVPVVPMAYSRKFAGLFGSLGYDHTVDCTSSEAPEVHDKVIEGFRNRAALAEQGKMAFAEGQRRLGLYEDGLHAVMSRL